jgi:hypothetical protein
MLEPECGIRANVKLIFLQVEQRQVLPPNYTGGKKDLTVLRSNVS